MMRGNATEAPFHGISHEVKASGLIHGKTQTGAPDIVVSTSIAMAHLNIC